MNIPRPDPQPNIQAPRIGDAVRNVSKNGNVTFEGVAYQVAIWMAGEVVHVVKLGTKVLLFDRYGDLLIEQERPPAGVRYIGNGRPRGGNHRPAHM